MFVFAAARNGLISADVVEVGYDLRRRTTLSRSSAYCAIHLLAAVGGVGRHRQVKGVCEGWDVSAHVLIEVGTKIWKGLDVEVRARPALRDGGARRKR